MTIAQVSGDRLMRLGTMRFRVALGVAGISGRKQEGDMTTPAGMLKLRLVLFRADRLRVPPATHLPREPIGPDDGWCDDKESVDYNRPVALPHPARHERLWRDDGLYDVVGVLGWNDAPVERGRGSAIFLHVATPDFAPTAGCVAMTLADLLRILAAGVDALEVLG